LSPLLSSVVQIWCGIPSNPHVITRSTSHPCLAPLTPSTPAGILRTSSLHLEELHVRRAKGQGRRVVSCPCALTVPIKRQVKVKTWVGPLGASMRFVFPLIRRRVSAMNYHQCLHRFGKAFVPLYGRRVQDAEGQQKKKKKKTLRCLRHRRSTRATRCKNSLVSSCC